MTYAKELWDISNGRTLCKNCHKNIKNISTYVFDLDNTLCKTIKGKYEEAKPYKDRIIKVNQLYERGNKIIIDTARGTLTGKEWYRVTENQLKNWGVKYHLLRTGQKIYANFYIDDHAINAKDFF